MNIWFTVRSFIAFYFVIFGFALLASVPDERALIGALFPALGLTFFWRLLVATITGM
jgi:hypothetical protein